MTNFKSLKKLFILLLLASQIFSCDTTCVDAEEFNIVPVNLESNMRKMKVGVFGDYNHDNGGQRAEWYDTGLRTNGTKLTLTLTGGWVYTGGTNSSTQEEVDSIPLCNYCSKDISDSNPNQNCICHNFNGQVPGPIIKDDGMQTTCSSSHHANPDLCTCINRGNDYVYRYGVYHQSLNSLQKTPNEGPRIRLRGDKQSSCRMNRGMGAYIALWGVNGAQTPTRAYHLYTQQIYCPMTLGPNGECERNGINVLRYVYQSPNNLIFVKNDGLQNNLPITSTSTPGFQYHGPNEVVKVIMYDGFYDDNAGKYSIYFVGGFGGDRTSFILEYITGMFEDVLLGARNTEGQRVGGILEFFYNSVVSNPPFQMTIQFMLVLYIVFFGGSYLMGVIDITRKEVSMVIFKIALIIMFTNPASWLTYKMFVVGTFKDGMDQLMAMIMMATDTATGDSSNLNYIAQGGRAIDGSNATRFSYPDLMMKKYLSPAVAKKLLGVIGDGNIYGILYFLITYALIFYFIYVILLVCSIYIVSFLKMILLLGLGPIFISLALFSKTNEMFKSWLAFLGSRAMEMAVLFLVLSPFLMLIDKYFTDLFYYKVCGVQKGIPPLNLIILQTTGLDRSLFEWLLMFIKIATVIFIMQTVLDRVPQMAGQLISIGGIPNQDTTTKVGYGASGFGLAIGAANSAIFGAIGAVRSTANYAINKSGAVPMMIGGATAIARKTGIASALNAIGKKFPFRGPRTRMRDAVIEGAINEARAEGKSNGLKGKELDQYIRESAMDNLAKRIANDPNKMAMLGVDGKNITKAMDRVLVRDGLKDFLKDRAQDLKAEGLLGKEMRQKLREDAKEWAKDNLYDSSGVKKVENYLKDRSIRSFLRSNAEYSTSEAAKVFKTNEERAKYLEHLEDLKHRNQKKWDDAKRNPINKMVPYMLSRAKHEVVGDVKGNPNLARKNFDRKAYLEENGRPTWARYLNPIAHINFLDRRFNKEKFEETRQLHDQLLQGRLAERLANDDEGIGEVNPKDKKTVRRQKAKKIGERDMMKDKLRELAVADIERQLNQETDFSNPSGSYSLPGSPERKEELKEKLFNDLFVNDGKTIFEKAIQYDHLADKEEGKPSMEQLVAQASFKDSTDLFDNIDNLTLNEIINRRENIGKGEAGKGLFVKKLDDKKHFLEIKAGMEGNFSQDNLFGFATDSSSQSSPPRPNQVSQEYENKLRSQLESIDRKIIDKINEEIGVYEEEIDRLDDTFEQIEQNSRSTKQRKSAKKGYADALRRAADGLETSLSSDISVEDYRIISKLRSTADAVASEDPSALSTLPKFDEQLVDKKFAGRADLDPQRVSFIRDQFKALESERQQSQDNIDQNPIRKVSLPEISPESLKFEKENVSKASYDVMSKSQDMLTEIGLWKSQNAIKFDGKDLKSNQRNIAILNEGFDQNRHTDSTYMVTQLDKNVSALRSIDTSFKMSGITSEFQKGLGAEQLSLVNDKLRGDMISLKQDIEQANKNNQPLTADQIKTRINEISEGKKQTLELYDQAVTVFKVESAIQRSVEEMSQLRSATEANLPTARAEMAPRYIPQGRANTQAEQNNDFAKFKNLKYDDKVTQDNPAFAKAIKQDLEFTSRVGDVLDGQIKTSKDQGNDVSKDVALKSKVDELSGVLKSTQSALKSTPEGTIDRAQNQRFADKIEDLKGQITKDHAKDLQKVDASSKQQMMTSIEKNDPRVSTMITQDRYPDPIVADQKLLNKSMQQDLQDLQHLQKTLNQTSSSATIEQTKSLSDGIKSMSSLLQDKIAKTEDRQTSVDKLSSENLRRIAGEVKEQRQEFFDRNFGQIAKVVERSAQSTELDKSFVKPDSLPIIPKASDLGSSIARLDAINTSGNKIEAVPDLFSPQNPKELKALLQRNIDGLQMLQSRLNALQNKTLSDIELRTKIFKIADNLQDKIEAVDRIPDQGAFKPYQKIQEITKDVEKEKTEILRDHDGSIRKVSENLGRQMVADSALSTKLSYAKGDIFKDIDVSSNPNQKELGADVSNVDRQLRYKLVTENNRSQELLLIAKEASEVSQDKSLPKIVEKLENLRKSEEKLLQDFDDFSKTKETNKPELAKGDKEKELNSLFDSNISKKYDEIKERRQNLMKAMKALDQSDASDQKYKTIVDQLTQMRANPYKADEYYQKVMPATSDLGDLLANPKVRDSLDSVGLRVGRYESSLSSSQSKDLDEKADAIKQNLSRPRLFSELVKESDLDQKTSSSSSLKDLSIAKIDSLKEESKFVKSQFDKLGQSKVLSSQEGFSQQIQDLTTEQKNLESLYGKAQGQIEKGSTLKELDVTMKEIKQTQDSFVAESKAFIDQNLSFVNAKINSNNPNISQQGLEDLNKLNKDLTQLDKQVTALDKAKISESTIDFVAPNRFEKFNESKESIVQGVVQDNLRMKEFQESLQKISDETGDKKLGTLSKDAQGIIESQQQAIKSFQDIDPKQPLNDDKKAKIDDLVFRLEDLNNRQRKLVEDYVKNNSSNPELLESIERAKKTYEFFDAENKANESKSFKSESVNANSSAQDQVAFYKAEARLEQVAGISKTLISSQISDALISGKISDALLSGKFQDVFLKGGLPMIGGAMASANPEFESQNATKLQTEKKIQQLSLKMDKLNMKLAEQQVTRMKEQMESKDKVSSAEKFEMMAKQSQLKELRESVSKRKSHISKINDQLGNKE